MQKILPKKKKITELTETRMRTVHHRNSYGELERDAEEWIFTRPVKTVTPNIRVLHYLVDYTIIQLIGYGVTALIENISDISLKYNIAVTIFTVFSSVPYVLFLYVIYFGGFEYIFGKTPGKFLTKTAVIDEHAGKPKLEQVFLRALVRAIPFEAFSCLGDKYSYGWHDKWTRTWVVTEDELAELKRLQKENEAESS